MKLINGELQLDPGESVTVKLKDQFGSVDGLNARITLNGAGQIEVAIDGYGDKTSQDGKGAPILIEKAQDRLRVICWGDINREDPTAIIGMEDARESNRSPEMGD